MTSLLQEIISVYTLLNPSQLTAAASNRVCNALALLQCVASHNETRALFLNGKYSIRAGETTTDIPSTHPTLPLPVPEHHLEVSTFRVPTIDLSGSHWGLGQERFIRCHQLPSHDRDYSSLSKNHGDRV